MKPLEHLSAAFVVLWLGLSVGPARGSEPLDEHLGLLSCLEEVTSAGCKLAWAPGASPRPVYVLEKLAATGQGVAPGRVVPDASGRLPPPARYEWRVQVTTADGSSWPPRMFEAGLYRVLGCASYDSRAGGTECASSLSFWLPEKPSVAALPSQVPLVDEHGTWSYANVNKDAPPEAMYSQYNTYLAVNVVMHAARVDDLPAMYPPHGNTDFLYASELDHIIHHNVFSNFSDLLDHLRGRPAASADGGAPGSG